MRPIRLYNKGFSLLEVLLAILLLGIGFAALIQVLNVGLFSGSVNENEIIAANLAQEKVEEIRNALFSNIATEDKATVTDFPAFSRQVDITTPQANLKQVTVTVYWSVKSAETSLSTVTYVSNI